MAKRNIGLEQNSKENVFIRFYMGFLNVRGEMKVFNLVSLI